MAPTLTAETAWEHVLESVIEHALKASPQFCSVCFTDRVVVIHEGLLYCPDCGQTTHTAQSMVAIS